MPGLVLSRAHATDLAHAIAKGLARGKPYSIHRNKALSWTVTIEDD
jgi:hypothetical protein